MKVKLFPIFNIGFSIGFIFTNLITNRQWHDGISIVIVGNLLILYMDWLYKKAYDVK